MASNFSLTSASKNSYVCVIIWLLANSVRIATHVSRLLCLNSHQRLLAQKIKKKNIKEKKYEKMSANPVQPESETTSKSLSSDTGKLYSFNFILFS